MTMLIRTTIRERSGGGSRLAELMMLVKQKEETEQWFFPDEKAKEMIIF